MFDSGRFRVLALALTDCLLLYGVWALVTCGYHAIGLGHYDPAFYLRMWPAGLVFVAANYLFRLYHGDPLYPAAPLAPVEELRRLVGSAVLTHLGIVAALALLYQTTEDYSRFVIVVSGVAVAFLAQPVRDLVRHVLKNVGLGQIPVVIVGSGKAAQHALKSFRSSAYFGFEPVGYFDEDGRALDRLPRLGGLRDVVAESRRRNVRILVACEDERLFQCQLREFTEWFAYIEYLPTAKQFPVFGSRTVSLGGMGGVEMVNQSRMRILRLEKWLLDKVFSIIAFAILLPVFAVIGIAIRVTSRGPVFFGHMRLGKKGRPIRIWKFRTMYADAEERLARILAEDPQAAEEWAANFKLKNDPRVTPLGRFLRKTSLDEIPQFINVFTGSMALVGPRPIVEAEIPYYGSSYDVFSSVKPGVTGLWQVSGRNDVDYDRRVALDVEYVLNWSPWLDIWILIRTVFAVLFLRGAF